MTTEQAIIQLFKAKPRHSSKNVIGIGDDAAFIKDLKLAVSNDTMVDGIHYTQDFCSAGDIAFKLVEKTVSDLYIKNAKPNYAILGMSLTSKTTADKQFMKDFSRELKLSLYRHGAALIGGDTTANQGKDVFNLTVFGHCEKFIPRKSDEIQTDDLVVVQGAVGASLLGFTQLQSNTQVKPLARAYQRPRAAAVDASWIDLLAKVTIDQSDSLYEVFNILANDNKIQFSVDIGAIPTIPQIDKLSDSEKLKYLLGGGEDFAVVALVSKGSQSKLPKQAKVVGRVIKLKTKPKVVYLNRGIETSFNKEITYFKHFE